MIAKPKTGSTPKKGGVADLVANANWIKITCLDDGSTVMDQELKGDLLKAITSMPGKMRGWKTARYDISITGVFNRATKAAAKKPAKTPLRTTATRR